MIKHTQKYRESGQARAYSLRQLMRERQIGAHDSVYAFGFSKNLFYIAFRAGKIENWQKS